MYGFTKIFAGDTDRSFVAGQTAWKKLGHDIDGKVTLNASTDVCKLTAGAPSNVQADGDNGIDNSFGANILPMFQAAASASSVSKPWSDSISQQGARTELLVLSGLTGGATQPLVPGEVFLSMPLGGVPKLDGSDTWPISSVNTNGKLPGGAVTSNVYDSGRTLGTAVFSMPSNGIAMNITLHHVRITGTLSGQAITDGVLSGVLATEEFVTELKRIAGAISTTLCGTQFDGIATMIRQAQDILDDGTQDPTKSCNGISVGLGFEAVSIKAGALLNEPPPPPDPCH